MAKNIMKQNEIIIKNGRPSAVIIDLKKYKEILEKLEDIEDLAELNSLKKKPLKFRKIEDLFEEYNK